MDVINTHYLNGYVAGQHYISYGMVNYKLVADHRFVASRFVAASSYRQIDDVNAIKNALVINRWKSNGTAEDGWHDFILYKVPKSTETLTWKNSGKSDIGMYYSYNNEAKKVTISYRNMQIQAIRVIEWQPWGDGINAQAIFWCKGLGDALRVDSDGKIVYVNEAVFGTDIVNNKAVKDATARIAQLDAIERQPKELKDGKVSFKPSTLPAELKDFAERFRTAIRNHEDLSAYIGKELLKFYKSDLTYRDNGTEGFARYMKDPYFSGLKVLAAELKYIEQSCVGDEYYYFPCFDESLEKYFENWQHKDDTHVKVKDQTYFYGMVYKNTYFYKEKINNQRYNYTASPYKVVLLQYVWDENGLRWHKAYSTKEDYLGYVHEDAIYVPGEYVFCIAKEDGEYKLVGVPECPATDDSFEYECYKRNQEKLTFYDEHKNEHYGFSQVFPNAYNEIMRTIDTDTPHALKIISDGKNGFTADKYFFNFDLSIYDRDSITVRNLGNIDYPIEVLRKAVNKCFDEGSMTRKTVVFEKYNYEVLISGTCHYSNIYDVIPIQMTLSLKNGEWIADKKHADLYAEHSKVCQHLIEAELTQNPKLKKVGINVIFFDSPDFKYYFKIASTVKVKKEADRYILGEQVRY